MRTFWASTRWRDVLVGAVVWALFLGECVALDHLFPSVVPGCVTTAVFSCWDVTGLLYALLSVPFWYVAWALQLRPCPWPLRWANPLVVSYAAYRLAGLGSWYGFA